MSEAVLLVPGLLCSAEVFQHQANALWPFGPVTVASTLNGRTVSEIASAILRDGPPKFALAGISFGGYICFEILRQAPERVARLAFLDTSARPDTAEQSERRRTMIAQAGQGDFSSWAEEALTSIMYPARHDDVRLRAINRKMGSIVGLEGFRRQTEAAILRPDSRNTLTSINVPTMVLVGADDKLIPPDHSHEIASAIPGARMVLIPECGHCSTLEQPELVSSALQEWMTED